MRIGILGGTGPAGRGLAVRLAAAGDEPLIGSRDPERARTVAAGLVSGWPDRRLAVVGAANEEAAACELVVVATPWEGALVTVAAHAPALDGKVVVSMVAGMVREGRALLPVLPGRGSVAASIQAVLPGSLVAASLHHLPASDLEDLDITLSADVLVCSDHPRASATTVELVDRIEGLRGVDAGSLALAGPLESFTAVLVSVNIRHKVHASLRLAGLGDR